jgi:hypothetical protein
VLGLGGLYYRDLITFLISLEKTFRPLCPATNGDPVAVLGSDLFRNVRRKYKK